jgi:hypothetical protein
LILPNQFQVLYKNERKEKGTVSKDSIGGQNNGKSRWASAEDYGDNFPGGDPACLFRQRRAWQMADGRWQMADGHLLLRRRHNWRTNNAGNLMALRTPGMIPYLIR